MSALTKRRAGQPLVVFLAVLLMWIAVRSLIWQSPFSEAPPEGLPFGEPRIAVNGVDRPPHPAADVRTGSGGRSKSLPQLATIAFSVENYGHIPALKSGLESVGKPKPAQIRPHSLRNADIETSHQILWMAAFTRPPGSGKFASMRRLPYASSGFPPLAKAKNNRGIGAHWSFDSWAFFRPAEPVGAAGPFAASYGGSQAGAVLRYQLEPRSRNKANIYVRVTKALNQQNEGDIAAGLAARPIAALPVSTQAELRLSRTAGGRKLLRPAALAVTEFSPIDLPLGFRSEFYAQGGYVGGEYATAFADGQVRVDRKLRSFDQANLRLGAGAWGGAQKGVARLDIGPSASVDMPIAGGSARLAIDYRYRIAGEANPPSGIVITLSTGF